MAKGEEPDRDTGRIVNPTHSFALKVRRQVEETTAICSRIRIERIIVAWTMRAIPQTRPALNQYFFFSIRGYRHRKLKNLFLVVAVVVRVLFVAAIGLVIGLVFFSPRYWLSNGC